MKCDLCEVTADGETFEQWMMALMPHYMEAHADTMQKMKDMSEEEMKAQKGKWMAQNKERFDAQ